MKLSYGPFCPSVGRSVLSVHRSVISSYKNWCSHTSLLQIGALVNSRRERPRWSTGRAWWRRYRRRWPHITSLKKSKQWRGRRTGSVFYYAEHLYNRPILRLSHLKHCSTSLCLFYCRTYFFGVLLACRSVLQTSKTLSGAEFCKFLRWISSRYPGEPRSSSASPRFIAFSDADWYIWRF